MGAGVINIAAILALVLASVVSVTLADAMSALPTQRTLNTDDYWNEDHPHSHQPQWKRRSDGKVEPANNDSTPNSFADYRSAVEAQTPWISKWVLSTQGRHTLKKDIPRLLMYNLVSPMDYGRSVRSTKVRRRRNKAMRMFLTDNLALPLLKSLGNVAWNLIQSHYVGYFEDEMFAKRLEMMNASEMVREFNLSLPIDAIIKAEDEEFRPNTTLRYTYDGASKRAQLYATYTAAFAPYEGYSDQYYTRDDNLPQPTLPADSYPWLWSPRLNLIRNITAQLMQTLTLDDIDSCSSSCAASEDTKLRQLSNLDDEISSIPRNITNDGSLNESAMNPRDIQALEQIKLLLQEFHFETGIPRFTLRSNETHSIFPPLSVFLRTSQTSTGDRNISSAIKSNATGTSTDFSDVEPAADFSVTKTIADNGDSAGDLTDFSSRSGVYAALTQFYGYPSVDNLMVARDKRFREENASACMVERPCWMQSGVTVYTPSLTTLTLFTEFANTSMDPVTKRAMRMEALLMMAKVAFEAERRVLDHGLQGPSTVWYSNHDLDVDEFADAVFGTVNQSISDDPTPLHVFENLMNERVPVLDEMVSYYADTNHDTKISMQLNHSVPMLDKFAETELVELVSLLASQMQTLDSSITSYVQTRAENQQYQEVVNTTERGDLYNGSEYTLLGFGFIMPATNDQNVLYHDMKLPVPFHLTLRLIVRFQESRLLLPEESRQLVVCLAMALHNISCYRCRPAE
ncbi:hypothetical protein PR003_g10145 [Phytophthora rubi]|uniref:Uncharacterized protein n=1 Tax=Phytophthora rubi TaxID=129364 RepID=A0A6A4FG60_9STRA|nr:hypothetical protein PR002_g23475 [Phytophthora rubi]KAE9341115.1 hypothetical protein PR003_g10145 [Phytophthora rubi]